MKKACGALSKPRRFQEGGLVEDEVNYDGVAGLAGLTVPQQDVPVDQATDFSDLSSLGATPAELRSLMALEAARGLLAPTRSGGSAEGWGNALGNMGKVTAEQLKFRTALQARLEAIQAQQGARAQLAREQIEGRKDIARIVAGKDAVEDLTPDDIKNQGLPPGTVAQRNKRTGKLSVVTTPSKAQQMIVGYDESGKPIYGEPGVTPTPKVRSDMQGYLRRSNVLIPQLEKTIENLRSGKTGQTALGYAGAGERAINATVGQIKHLIPGQSTEPFFKEDTEARSNMKTMNEQLIPLLSSDPRTSNKSRKEINEMLPDPDSWHEDVGTATEKLESVLSHIKNTSDQYRSVLSGESSVTDDQTDENPMGKTLSEIAGLKGDSLRKKLKSMTPEQRQQLHQHLQQGQQ